ncbi:TetR/AcrR family transcriptional regulator C-terminal domain-containing protein [Cryptosporangium arvum]|uniref:TetR/AcrR family transcriptional regulator C-terminal domain-containing protein n=1 Tax=Cryptosporangium arvum TaxID=80871 RepID=UPI0004B91F3A|nr:GntR family transcriptional regulator [Cryptosporangium arvum]
MTPSARITAELRERITSGDLAPGDRLPSTRQITRQWGVAMATATKVLTALRQEGLVEAVPGVGTVVRSVPAGELPPPGVGTVVRSASAGELPPPGLSAAAARRPREGSLSRERIVDAAVRIADADGMTELSMRRVAAELGVATMALYRYVPSKEDLITLMLDAVFGTVELIPEPQPVGWRARLDSIARIQWAAYKQHPWMAGALSFSRPQLVPRGMVHTEYAMATLHEAGLEPAEYLNGAVSLFNHVRGMAMVFADEQRAIQDTGLSADEWMQGNDSYYLEVMATGRFPMMALVSTIPEDVLTLESLFEFGLARYLDGLEVLISRR